MNHPTDPMTPVRALIEAARKATPGPWKTRGGEESGPTASLPMFVQAPRLDPSHRYDIEVLGEDRNEDLYPPELAEADCKFIVAARNATASISQLLSEHDKVVALIAELGIKAQADAKANNCVTGIAVAWDFAASRLQSIVEGK